MAVTENDFSGQVAVVTGGAKGIGRACVEAYLQRGAKVAVISRTQAELEAMAKQLGVGERLYIAKGDVSDEKAVASFFEETEERLGRVSILINNAAVVVMKLVDQMSVEEWDQAMAVNVRGVFLCSRELFQRRKKDGGKASIVNISSLAGIRATDKFPGFSSYAASKFAVVGLTECLAAEGAALGIRTNCIAPGAVDTELLRRAAPHLKTQTTPQDIAQSVLFLTDETRAGKINGTTLELFTNQK